MDRIVVEICAAATADALGAIQQGAGRIELCSALSLGGLTPSLAVLIDVCAAASCPVIAMVRPREGGFSYDETEFTQLQHEVDLLLENGAAGIAVGLLNPTGQLDRQRCALLKQQVHPRQLVFHRAFDLATDHSTTLDQLIDLGWTRILTSGCQVSALHGAARIAALVSRAAGRIEVTPAGGIRADNVREVVRQTRCRSVHAGASCVGPLAGALPRETPQLRFDLPPLPRGDQFRRVDPQQVRALVEALGCG